MAAIAATTSRARPSVWRRAAVRPRTGTSGSTRLRGSVLLRGTRDRLARQRRAHEAVPPRLEGTLELALLAVGPAHRHGGDRAPVAQAESRHHQIVRLVSAARLDLPHLPPPVGRADVDPRPHREPVRGALVVEAHLEGRRLRAVVAPG